MNRATIGPVTMAWVTHGDLSAEQARVSGRALLTALVSERAGIPADAVVISATCADCGGAHGRPVVEHPPDLYASVAHCAEGTVAAIAAVRVGVDVELTAGNPERLHAIDQVAGAGADPLLRWTRAEAVLKADGRGLRVDPQAIHFGSERASLGETGYRLMSFTSQPGWVVSVAIADGPAAGREAAS
jgi:4'-phosphopantetheinyl transferase